MILVTSDGSQRSAHVFSHAAALAQACDDRLEVIQVFDPTGLARETGRAWPGPLHDEALRIEAGLQILLDSAGVVAISKAVPQLQGESVARAILRHASASGARLIAIDSRGHNAVRQALLGSVAMGVASEAEVPVMVAGPRIEPPHTSPSPYRVLVTTDGSEGGENVLYALQPLLPHLEVSLMTVFVPTLGDKGDASETESLELMLKDLETRHLPGQSVTRTVQRADGLKPVEDVAIDVARRSGVDALAMSMHTRSLRRSMLLGSFASACLSHSHVPLIFARR